MVEFTRNISLSEYRCSFPSSGELIVYATHGTDSFVNVTSLSERVKRPRPRRLRERPGFAYGSLSLFH